MDYERTWLPEAVPRAADPLFQHLLDTYASETNKTASVWTELRDDQLAFRPHLRSSTVREILAHQLLSERRFFAEFIGLEEPAAALVLPPPEATGVAPFRERLIALAAPRLAALAGRDREFWLAPVPFFDVTRER
ncbi:MAG TPA: DinB family protein, partial [Gemmatimonadales bacterium]|nr:DinB family protein [Gemmatimonadales bacterium]